MPEHAWNHDDILKRDSLSQKQCVVTGTVFRPHNFCIIEGSLEVKLPTIWTDEKQRWKSQRKEEKKKENQRRESQKQEDPGARKGRKVAKHCVFPMICGSGGSKSRLAKAAGAEPSGQMRDEKMHACRGAKHISKSKVCRTLTNIGPLFAS